MKGDVGIRKEGWVGRKERRKGRIEKCVWGKGGGGGRRKNYFMKGVSWPRRGTGKKVFEGGPG